MADTAFEQWAKQRNLALWRRADGYYQDPQVQQTLIDFQFRRGRFAETQLTLL